jgi:hypothetical protein
MGGALDTPIQTHTDTQPHQRQSLSPHSGPAVSHATLACPATAYERRCGRVGRGKQRTRILGQHGCGRAHQPPLRRRRRARAHRWRCAYPTGPINGRALCHAVRPSRHGDAPAGVSTDASDGRAESAGSCRGGGRRLAPPAALGGSGGSGLSTSRLAIGADRLTCRSFEWLRVCPHTRSCMPTYTRKLAARTSWRIGARAARPAHRNSSDGPAQARRGGCDHVSIT